MSGIIADNSGRHTGLVKAASAGGVWNLIETLTASSSATLSFTSGIDSTYDEYVFKFINIHSSESNKQFRFQANVAGGSGYNETVTNTYFRAFHQEDDGAATLTCDTGRDQAQGTGFIEIISDIGNDNEDNGCGTLQLFAPSDTTFVKHFISTSSGGYTAARHVFVAGYFNTTSAIDEIQFKMDSGDIDAGTISLYGIN